MHAYIWRSLFQFLFDLDSKLTGSWHTDPIVSNITKYDGSRSAVRCWRYWPSETDHPKSGQLAEDLHSEGKSNLSHSKHNSRLFSP